jgi:hypothetical protein
MHAAGNAADGDLTPEGDYIYTTSATVPPATRKAVLAGRWDSDLQTVFSASDNHVDLESGWPMRACNIRISDLTGGEDSDTPPCGRLAWRVGTWVLAEPLVWCSWRSSWLFP